MQIRNMTRCAVMLTVALVIFVLESYVPSVLPVPGAKLGLSNIITLITMHLMGYKNSFIILILRITIGSFVFAGLMTFMYSICGGVLSFVVLLAFYKLFGRKYIIFSGVLSAVFHNIGQLLVAAFVLKSMSVFVYFPALCVIGGMAGFFTGAVAKVCIDNKYIQALFID